MEKAMQIIFNDKTVKNDTVQDLKEFNQQSLTTQAKKGEQLVSMMPAIKKAFILLGDDIVELSTKNDALKNQIGSYDEKWFEEFKARLLQQIDGEKRANLVMSRMKKQCKNINFHTLIQLLFYKWLIYLTTNFGKVSSMVLFRNVINYKI